MYPPMKSASALCVELKLVSLAHGPALPSNGKAPRFAKVEHVEPRSPELAAELQRVAAEGVRKVIGQVPGCVDASQSRRFAHTAVVEPGDFDIRRAEACG